VTTLADILHRLRRHGVPGPPRSAGVPADRTAELEAELAPVFNVLEGTTTRARQIREQADRDAAGIMDRARQASDEIVAEARAQVASARARATAAGLDQAEQARRRILAAGRSEAQRIDRAAAEHVPAWADALVAHILAPPGQAVPGLAPESPS
jgi:cell division septum initiation protein DivIVA